MLHEHPVVAGDQHFGTQFICQLGGFLTVQVAKGTVDTKVLRALRHKVDLAKSLVDDYRKGINPFKE